MLLAAAAGLVLVVGLAVVAIVARSGEPHRAPASAPPAPSVAEADDVTRPPGPTTAIAPALVTAAPPARRPATAPAPADTTTNGEVTEGEVPIWARRPTVTTQPFPEGGRINTPLPPVRIPAWMIPPGTDASAIRTDESPAPSPPPPAPQ